MELELLTMIELLLSTLIKRDRKNSFHQSFKEKILVLKIINENKKYRQWHSSNQYFSILSR